MIDLVFCRDYDNGTEWVATFSTTRTLIAIRRDGAWMPIKNNDELALFAKQVQIALRQHSARLSSGSSLSTPNEMIG